MLAGITIDFEFCAGNAGTDEPSAHQPMAFKLSIGLISYSFALFFSYTLLPTQFCSDVAAWAGVVVAFACAVLFGQVELKLISYLEDFQ